MSEKQMKPVIWVGDSKRRDQNSKKEIDLIRDRLNWAKELAQEQNENEQRTN